MNARLQRVLWGLFLVASLPVWIVGCTMRADRSTISQVVYAADSGPILPELQWHQRFTIREGGVTFARNGRVSATEVNAGTWELAAEARAVRELFARLETVDCAAARRIEPDDPPDGGGAESFEIIYANGKTCTLTYDPGVTYTGGEQVTAPVRAFVRGLTLPADAAPRQR